MNRSKCPHCDDWLVNPSGPENAEILLVGEFPGVEEVKQGNCFVGATGDILKMELGRVGIQLAACRSTNLWQHARNDVCDVSWHLDQMYKEFKGRKYILLMGSELTQTIFGKGVFDLSGLRVKVKGTDAVVFVSPNPALVMHAPVGEFRLAVKNFKKEINRVR